MVKCPKCEKSIATFSLHRIESQEGIMGPKTKTTVHCCPFCKSVLSVETDPQLFKAEIVREVLKGLGR